MFSSSNKPYSAVTVRINNLTSEQYEADDMSGIPDLIEVIRIQNGGPTEAARALRKKLKYGSVYQQLRALTILDGLIENAGPRFQRAFADEPLLERLRVCATDSLADAEVKQKCQVLFRQWAVAYRSTPGMERVAALERQLPKRKKPVRQEQSRVLKETEPSPNEDPFGNEDEEAEESSSQSVSTPTHSTFSSSSTPAFTGPTPDSYPKQSKKSRPDKHGKKARSKAFNLEKEKPQILQSIASSSIASTNLMNTLKLIDREHKRVSEQPETVQRFETCKVLRRQILRYIQHIESEQWLGSLIHANDGLVEALMAFEILDKSVEDDSDSEDASSIPSTAPSKPPRPESNKHNDVSRSFAGLDIHGKAANAGRGKLPRYEAESESEPEPEPEDDEGDNPFADRNAVHDPKSDRPGLTWRDV